MRIRMFLIIGIIFLFYQSKGQDVEKINISSIFDGSIDLRNVNEEFHYEAEDYVFTDTMVYQTDIITGDIHEYKSPTYLKHDTVVFSIPDNVYFKFGLYPGGAKVYNLETFENYNHNVGYYYKYRQNNIGLTATFGTENNVYNFNLEGTVRLTGFLDTIWTSMFYRPLDKDYNVFGTISYVIVDGNYDDPIYQNVDDFLSIDFSELPIGKSLIKYGEITLHNSFVSSTAYDNEYFYFQPNYFADTIINLDINDFEDNSSQFVYRLNPVDFRSEITSSDMKFLNEEMIIENFISEDLYIVFFECNNGDCGRIRYNVNNPITSDESTVKSFFRTIVTSNFVQFSSPQFYQLFDFSGGIIEEGYSNVVNLNDYSNPVLLVAGSERIKLLPR